MRDEAVLSIDAGSQSVRAALYSLSGRSLSGRRLGLWQQPCRQNERDQTHVEQDAAAIVSAARLCLDQVPADAKVSAAGVVSQGSSVVCWDRVAGQPLSPVMSWQDRRGEPYVERAGLTNDEVHALTGLPLSCHYGASKLRWCLDHLPSVREARQNRTLRGGPLVSYLLYQICRERLEIVDSGNASRTQLWNLHEQRWDGGLASGFGVPVDVLPDGADNLSSYGHIELPCGNVPVELVHRDQQAALFAGGRPRADTAYVNVGTGAFIQCLINTANGPTALLINRVLSGDGGEPRLFSLEGTVHGAAGATAWMEREVGSPISPQHLHDALSLDPDRGKRVYFINGVMGMGSPYWRPTVASRFSPRLSDGEKLLAWLESVVFMLIDNLRMMPAEVDVDRIRVSGGWSRLPGFVQRLADLSGLECCCDRDHEASQRGAAFLAAGQPDDWQVEPAEVYPPQENPGLIARYTVWKQEMANT